jgi:hypothetical protein
VDRLGLAVLGVRDERERFVDPNIVAGHRELLAVAREELATR